MSAPNTMGEGPGRLAARPSNRKDAKGLHSISSKNAYERGCSSSARRATWVGSRLVSRHLSTEWHIGGWRCVVCQDPVGSALCLSLLEEANRL